jgi:nicotinate-nucleotide--dimethylbenzimidazole phosphoribosyltransferase
VGTGTGVDDDALERKLNVVEQAVARNDVSCDSAADWLAAVGGFEIAAMAGAVEAAWELHTPLLIDGFIATAAVVAAWRNEPRVLETCLFGHCSAEIGHGLVLDELGVEPLLDLDLRLGEGSGAALAFPLVRAAAHILTDMATFAEAGVDQSAN